MALDAAAIVRAASGGLFFLLGLAVFVVGRRKRGPVGLALLLSGIGAEVMVSNISGNENIAAVKLELLATLFSTAGAFLVARELPRRMQRGERASLWIGLLVGAAALTGIVEATLVLGGVGESYGLGDHLPLIDAATLIAATVLFFVPAVGYFVALGVRAAISPPQDRASTLRALALVGLLAPYFIFYVPTVAHGRIGTLVASLALVLGLAVPWLIVAARTRDRLALAAALVWPALGVLSFSYSLVGANGRATFYDAYGLFGILRLLGWGFLVYVIARHDLLGVPLPRLAASRGAMAAGALATLFIVAQVAQNFFSAEYGLLTGGIVAGAFLFAASPLQRAMEGLREGRRVSDPSTPLAPDVRAEDLYRENLRIVLKDQRVTAEEEQHLAELGERLGISARRAVELRHDIEREKGVR